MLRHSCAVLLLVAGLAGADPAAYALFDGDGRRLAFDDLADRAAAAEVVCFGELHNNAPAHWLQRRLAAALFGVHGARLVLGAEMYERDDQLILDEYLAGRIRPKDLETEAKLWPNHTTDYLPLLDFAKEHGLRMVASNVPRRYAALVARDGLEALATLPEAARALFARQPMPLDATLPGYAAMLEMAAHGGPNGERLIQAQALKDATMAESVLAALGDGRRFLHFNGAYHTDGREGLVWYLRQARPAVTVYTITTAAQDDLTAPADELKGRADAILVTPSDFTTTH